MTTSDGPESRHHPDEQELARIARASDALQQLLAAASAPPSTAELTGRSRAIAAFRAAYRSRRPTTASSYTTTDAAEPDQLIGAAERDADGRAGDEGRTPAGSRRRTRLARARRWSAAQLTVAGAALLMLLGATAAAAAAGQLPRPLRDTVSDLFDGPDDVNPGSPPARHSPSVVRPPSSAPSSSSSSSSAPSRTAPQPPAPAVGSHEPSSRPDSGPGSAPAQLAGLCRAYRAAGPATLSRPGFLPLVTAAGGSSGVKAYCAAQPGTGRDGTPAGKAPATAPPVPKARPTASSPKAPPERQPARSHQPGSPHPSGSAPGAAPSHPRSAVTAQAGKGLGHRR